MQKDIRWQQRFDNFNRALTQLGNAVALMHERKLSLLEEQGLIQAFEYTHELAWKVLKDYLEDYGGYNNLIGSRDTTREAFNVGIITGGDTWMEMIKSRNLSSHTYNEEIATTMVDTIPTYYAEFVKLQTTLNGYL